MPEGTADSVTVANSPAENLTPETVEDTTKMVEPQPAPKTVTPAEQEDRGHVDEILAAMDEAHPKDAANDGKSEGEHVGEPAGEQKDEEGGEAPSELDARLQHTAERAGLTDDDIAALGDKAAGVLGKLAEGQTEIDTRLAEIGRAKQPEGEPPAGEDDKFDISTPIASVENRKDEDGDPLWSPEFMEFYNTQNKALEGLRAAVLGLHEKVEPMHEDFVDRGEREYTQNIDGFFESLGKGYEKLYGQGSGADMDESNDSMKARRATVDHANALKAGLEAIGKDYDFKDLLKRAHYAVNVKFEQDRARQLERRALRKRGKQITPRPSSTHATPKTRTDEQAIDEIAQMMRDRGLGT